MVRRVRLRGLIGASAPCPPSAGPTGPSGFTPGRVAPFFVFAVPAWPEIRLLCGGRWDERARRPSAERPLPPSNPTRGRLNAARLLAMDCPSYGLAAPCPDDET